MFNTIITVFQKEIIDLFRDKKTIMVGMLIPLIIFPILFGVIGKSMDNSTKSVEKNLRISLQDAGNSSLTKFLESQQNIKLISSDSINDDVKSGKVLLGIEIPKDFDSIIGKDEVSSIKLIYDNSSQQSQTAFQRITSLIEKYSKNVAAEKLSKRNLSVNILNPINVNKETVVNESEGASKLLLSTLLPLILVLYSITGTMSAASDLGAGEKERGTLEPLLTTKSGRLSLLWGKFLAINVIGIITTSASIAGIYIAMVKNKNLFQGGVGAGIPVISLILIAIVIILTTMAFGALELAISIYARSFKEATTYITPLTFVALIPVYSTYMLDAKNIPSIYFNIPLSNIISLLKELISGIYNYNHIFITFGWVFVYVIVSIFIARFMFNNENVIFRN